MLTNEELMKYLGVLGIVIQIGDICSVKHRDASIAFQRLAKVLHPDKAGPDSREAFQKLRDAYEHCRDHFEELKSAGDHSISDMDDDQKFFFDNFEKFNFPFENKGSFTVNIEDSLADIYMARLYNKTSWCSEGQN